MNTKQLQAENEQLCTELANLKRAVSAIKMRRYTKGELLAHYADKKVGYFSQFDAFACGDERGEPVDEMYFGTTAELMGAGTVRILICQGTTQETAVRLLDKLRKEIASEAGARALTFTVEQEADNECPF